MEKDGFELPPFYSKKQQALGKTQIQIGFVCLFTISINGVRQLNWCLYLVNCFSLAVPDGVYQSSALPMIIPVLQSREGYATMQNQKLCTSYPLKINSAHICC